MRSSVFIALAVLALASVMLSTGTVDITRDSGMSLLANLTNESGNQSQNATQNATTASEDQAASTGSSSSSALWSWGTIPIGYDLDENGTLIKLDSTEWSPSI